MPHLSSALGVFAERGRAFLRERRGNIPILFGLSLVPMVGLAGLGVDYGMALSAKSKLDNAADAAALSAVATAKAYVAEHATDANVLDAAKAAGLDRAKRAFAVNAGAVSFANVPTPVINLDRNGQTFSATVSYSTNSTTQFGRLFGKAALSLGGSSAARADVPSYLDFYLLIDDSGSMGIPTASADQTTLASVNGGCQFACHFSDDFLNTEGSGKWGYNIAISGYTKKKATDGSGNWINDKQVLSGPIQLRAGAVNNALCLLLTRAQNPAVDKQYRVGIYPFVSQIGTLASLTSDIDSLRTLADCASTPPKTLTTMLDTGEAQLATNGDPSKGVGSGGTHFENTIPNLQKMILSFGDGSSASTPKSYVFLITDGLDNSQYRAVQSGSNYLYVGSPNKKYTSYTSSSASWIGGSKPQLIDNTLCTNLKNKGVTLSILYIPYVPLAVGSANADETKAVNALIPQIPGSLKTCASPGFFYTGSTQADITTSLDAMFNQAVQVAHLSQ